MRPIVVILLLVALTIAGLTAYLVNTLLGDRELPAAAGPEKAGPATEQVLVAAVEIKPGVVVKAEDLRYENWPAAGLDSRLVRRGGGEDPKPQFVGAVARRGLLPGEPMTANAVFRQDDAGILSGLLSPGMRAVTVAVTPTTGVSGFILPHDRVDIVLNQDVRNSAGVAGVAGASLAANVARFASEVVLANLRVLAVDDKLVKPDAAANMPARTITVEVTPKDAEVLLAAGRLGELSLALRSLAPGEVPADRGAGYTGDIEASRALQAAVGGGEAAEESPKAVPAASGARSRPVRVNRGGSTSTQSFSN